MALSLVVALGCKTQSVPSEPVKVEAPKAPAASTPMPAFIVIRREHTEIVPVDGVRGPFVRHGMWTMLPSEVGAQIGGLFAAELTTDLDAQDDVDVALPVCATVDVVGGCEVGSDDRVFGQAAIDARGRVRWGLSPGDFGRCDCLIVDQLSTDPVLSTPSEDGLDSEDDARETCLDQHVVPRSLAVVGATLYRAAVWDNAACSGVHVVDLVGDSVPLIPGADPLSTSQEPKAPYCDLSEQPNVDWLAQYEARCQLDTPDCERCYHDDELEAYAIRRGELFHVTGSASAAGGTCTCASPRPLSSDRCPSPVDTCGEPAQFEGALQAAYFWVETQSRWAISGDANRLELRSPAKTLATIAGGADVLGVHFVEDARPLALLEWQAPQRVGLEVPALGEADRRANVDARAWADRCRAHLEAQRLDAAEAACMRGLLDDGATASTRGTITFRLGTIAESRGELGRARAFYERSLVLAPDDAAVGDRLRGL